MSLSCSPSLPGRINGQSKPIAPCPRCSLHHPGAPGGRAEASSRLLPTNASAAAFTCSLKSAILTWVTPLHDGERRMR
jgi:hypothetical protein